MAHVPPGDLSKLIPPRCFRSKVRAEMDCIARAPNTHTPAPEPPRPSRLLTATPRVATRGLCLQGHPAPRAPPVMLPTHAPGLKLSTRSDPPAFSSRGLRAPRNVARRNST